MITEEDFTELTKRHYIGGPFNGYDYAGYIGNSDRNYLTDTWVLAGANALGWDLVDLALWLTSRWGRWALDSQPVSVEEMTEQMSQADLAGLLEETVTA